MTSGQVGMSVRRLVLDNNQAQLGTLRAAIAQWRPAAIVVPPLVVVEILLRPESSSLLRELVGVQAVIGMDFLFVFKAIAELDEAGIAAFEPLCAFGGPTLAEVVANGEAVTMARQVKLENRANLNRLRDSSVEVRARLAKGDEPRLQSIEEAETKIDLGPHVVAAVTNDGKRRARLDDAALVVAVRKNPYLTRFFRSLLAYMLCVSGAWDQQRFRGVGVDFAPGGGRSEDDWTDVSLFLYASDGDVILSADRGVRALARIIDPMGAVRVVASPAQGGAA